jgi:hypothetical protein
MFRRRPALLLIPLALAAGPAAASTRWTITDPDRTKAAATATEQARQKAAAERSCYVPASSAQCRRLKDGRWSCAAENPARGSSCGKGRWKQALPAA